MQLPSDLGRVYTVANTNPVAFTTTSYTVCSAPGVGMRRRIWAIFARAEVGCAVGEGRILWQEPAISGVIGLTRIVVAAGGVFYHDDDIYFPGGLTLPENRFLDGQTYATVGTMIFRVTVLFTTEAV